MLQRFCNTFAICCKGFATGLQHVRTHQNAFTLQMAGIPARYWTRACWSIMQNIYFHIRLQVPSQDASHSQGYKCIATRLKLLQRNNALQFFCKAFGTHSQCVAKFLQCLCKAFATVTKVLQRIRNIFETSCEYIKMRLQHCVRPAGIPARYWTRACWSIIAEYVLKRDVPDKSEGGIRKQRERGWIKLENGTRER